MESRSPGKRDGALPAAPPPDFPVVIEKIVRVNVGGTLYTTSRDTLVRRQDTMLNAMFSGRHPLEKDADGCYFIDRDGELFKYVLNYLRDGGEVDLPSDRHLLQRLRREARFYGITELETLIASHLGPEALTPKTPKGPDEEDSPAVIVTWTFGFTGTSTSGNPHFKSDNMDQIIRDYHAKGYKLVGVTRWPETTHSRAGQQLIFRRKYR